MTFTLLSLDVVSIVIFYMLKAEKSAGAVAGDPIILRHLMIKNTIYNIKRGF
tara:strand:- start:269 stop:424 length:156 start_codon:yes stop_codon:yes gene_type:complete